MTPIDWDSPTWGKSGHNVHVADWAPDEHDATEAAAERNH